jgi:hypothetical protein
MQTCFKLVHANKFSGYRSTTNFAKIHNVFFLITGFLSNTLKKRLVFNGPKSCLLGIFLIESSEEQTGKNAKSNLKHEQLEGAFANKL